MSCQRQLMENLFRNGRIRGSNANSPHRRARQVIHLSLVDRRPACFDMRPRHFFLLFCLGQFRPRLISAFRFSNFSLVCKYYVCGVFANALKTTCYDWSKCRKFRHFFRTRFSWEN
jgi:hypothetical protein